MTEFVYASWGGSGRSAALRQAVDIAVAEGVDLVYLAILDRRSFADLDPMVIEAVEAELDWMLRAQIAVARRELGANDVVIRVVVRAGEVDNVIEDFVRDIGSTRVLLGAPILDDPRTDHNRSLDELVADLESTTKAEVSIVGADPA